MVRLEDEGSVAFEVCIVSEDSIEPILDMILDSEPPVGYFDAHAEARVARRVAAEAMHLNEHLLRSVNYVGYQSLFSR